MIAYIIMDEYTLAAMCNSTNRGTELGVGLRWPDPIVGKRHAVLASCLGTNRQEALVAGCLSLAEWIAAQRWVMRSNPTVAAVYESALGSALKTKLVKTHSLMGSIAAAVPGLDARLKANRETSQNTDKTVPFVLLNYMADDLKESSTETSDYPGYEGGGIVALCAQHVGGAAQQVPVASAHLSPTEEMLVRGKEAKALFELGAFASTVTEEEVIYRAMAAVAPVELVSAGELATLRERDEALAKAAYFEAEAFRLANGPPTRHPPEFVAKILMDREGRHDDPMALARLTEVIRCARLDGCKQARDELAAKDARIAELKTILAEKVKSETPSDTKPAPAPKEFPAGALKPNGSDPRRMGPT